MSAERIAAGVLALAALVLHIVFLQHAGALWRDEVNSFEFARMPLSAAAHNLQYDSFPLLSTVLLHGWVGSGAGAAADHGLRIYGFVIGVCFLAAIWLTCRMIGGRAVTPVISLALVGMAPWVIQSVDSIRPYGVGIVLIVLTAGFVWKVASGGASAARATGEASERGRGRATNIAIATVLAVLSVQAMYQNAFLLLAIGIAGMVVAWRRSDARAAITVAAIGALAALSLAVYLPAMAGARVWDALVQKPSSVSWLFTMFADAASPTRDVLGPGFFLTIWAVLLLLCAWMGFRSLRESLTARREAPPSPALYGGMLAVIAVAISFLALKAANLGTEPWYYVPLMALIAPGFDIAIASSAGSTASAFPGRVARLGLAIALAGVTFAPAWQQVSMPRTSIDRAASLIAREAEPTDLVVVFPFFLGVSFQHYYHGTTPWTTVPPLTEVRIHRNDLVKEAMIRPADAIAPVLSRMAATMKSGHRVWIVGSLPALDPGIVPQAMPPAPGSPSGWRSGPYFRAWGQQIAWFLTSHATAGHIAQGLSGGKVSRFEDVPVTVPSGWKDSGALAP